MSDRNERILERLTHLTARGHIHWRRYHDDEAETVEDSTGVMAYVAEDEIYGFGRLYLQRRDLATETLTPVLTISGRRFDEAKASDVAMLVDQVEAYIDEVMAGDLTPLDETISKAIEEVVEGMEEQTDHLREFSTRLLEQLEEAHATIASTVELSMSAHALARQTIAAGAPTRQPPALTPEHVYRLLDTLLAPVIEPGDIRRLCPVPVVEAAVAALAAAPAAPAAKKKRPATRKKA